MSTLIQQLWNAPRNLLRRLRLVDDLEAVTNELRALSKDLKYEATAELSFTVHDFVRTANRLKGDLAELRSSAESGLDRLEGRQLELKNSIVQLATNLSGLRGSTDGRLNQLENQQFETKNLVVHLTTSLSALRDQLENQLFESKNLIVQLATNLSGLRGSTDSRLNQLENQQFETKNLVVHLTTSLSGLRNQLENQQFESKNLIVHLTTSLDARLNKFENELLPAVNNEVHGSIATGLDIRARLTSPQSTEVDLIAERYEPAKVALDDYLRRAEREFPETYRFWRERLDAIRDAFLKTKIGNAAHAGDTYSHIFRSLVQMYARGHVLDVGCGIFGVPYYLNSYPTELISGLDPLKSGEPPVFEFVQGISEYLPWRDNAFSTVISATSLDHCLSLDRSLSEIRRVLQPNGRLLLWIGSNSGSVPYEPSRRDFAPVDEFHLFHFDVAWFEPMLERWFEVVERIELRKTTFSHVFYCLTKKAEVGADGNP